MNDQYIFWGWTNGCDRTLYALRDLVGWVEATKPNDAKDYHLILTILQCE